MKPSAPKNTRKGRLRRPKHHHSATNTESGTPVSADEAAGDGLARSVISRYWARQDGSRPHHPSQRRGSHRPSPRVTGRRRPLSLRKTSRPEPITDQVAEVNRRMTRVPWFIDPSDQRNLMNEKRRTRDPLTPVRRCYNSSTVADVHGYLSQQNIEDLVNTTGYNRRELYALFGRFKALCGLSSTPKGIDKETFRKGVPMLSVEDDLFVDRVFEVLDDDGSAIIEWEEFIEAMSALEKGSRAKRTAFLFKVYDMDKDGGISKEELYQFFLSSLMVSVDDNIREVSGYFVEQIFSEVDVDGDGKMTVEEAYHYIEKHPEVKDIYGMFGRSMTSDQINRIEALNGADAKTEQAIASARRRLRNEALSAATDSLSPGALMRRTLKGSGGSTRTILLRQDSSSGSLASVTKKGSRQHLISTDSSGKVGTSSQAGFISGARIVNRASIVRTLA